MGAYQGDATARRSCTDPRRLSLGCYRRLLYELKLQRKMEVATVADIRCMTEANTKPIQYDSFIAPAVRRRIIKTIHWFCLQSEHDTEPGFEDEFLSEFECRQIFHNNHADFIDAPIDKPILFDLCLDLFNHNDGQWSEGSIWSDDDIDSFLQSCRKLICNAEVVTVSLSFDYSVNDRHSC